MAKMGISTKRLQIDKSNATVTMVMAVASFLTIASLATVQSLVTRRSYQSRVVKEKSAARDQLEANKAAVAGLKVAYAAFVDNPTNVLGGLSAGSGERDGDNAKLTLDALPSKYDFPALATSIEKLLTARNFKFEGFTGNDDEIAQKNNVSASPQPVEMPFGFRTNGSYTSIVDLLKVLENTIRPMHITKLNYTANNSELAIDVSAKTYYLPGKTLKIESRDVK